MDVLLIPLLSVLDAVIGIYVWVVIASVVMSWLISFQVVNLDNNFVIMLNDLVTGVTEPVLERIRKILPSTGAMDFSPLVVIIVAWFFRAVLGQLMSKLQMVPCFH